MTETIDCPTCGGSGELDSGRPPNALPEFTQKYPCPDCIRGRQPSRELLERMAKAILAPYRLDLSPRRELWMAKALSAWLAEHKEDE